MIRPKDLPVTDICKHMEAADAAALANVLHTENGKAAPKGGPFGSRTFMFSDGDVRLVPAGAMWANAVVETGIASNHAEAMGMQPEAIAILAQALDSVPAENLPGTHILDISSAESCPACYAKEIIKHDHLVTAGLLQKNNMTLVFGATYEQTLKIAGFNDLPYAVSTVGRSINPEHPSLLVHTSNISWNNLSPTIRKAFAKHAESVEKPQGFAVVHRGHSRKFRALMVEGYDMRPESIRQPGDVFATAEVSAIRNKCLKDRENGIFESWSTPGTLYTLTKHLGPLAHAEMMWGSITNAKTVVDLPHAIKRAIPQTQESPVCTNKVLFKRASGGYNSARAHVQVVRSWTPNLAQAAWPAVVRALGLDGVNAHYDGLSSNRGLEQFMKAYEARFGIKKTPFIGGQMSLQF